MLAAETQAEILSLFYRDHLKVRAIAREVGVNRVNRRSSPHFQIDSIAVVSFQHMEVLNGIRGIKEEDQYISWRGWACSDYERGVVDGDSAILGGVDGGDVRTFTRPEV